ncbi:hypothetical protein CPC16_009446 [Podila verticillata]|nr:hypothetical protein CPC16_009446 [Podila verticillata]
MATLTASSQTAEAILSRARRLSSNAFERVHPPTSFSEGEDHRTSTNSGLFDLAAHRRSISQQRASISRISTSTTSNDALPPSTSLAQTTTTTTTDPIVLVQSPQESTIDKDNNNNCKDTFLDPGAQTLPHASTGLTPIPSRPRALTLEAVHESLSPPSSPGQIKGEDAHRKHRSEDGSGLVRGILVAFRQQIALDSPTSDRKMDKDIVTEASLVNSGYLIVSAPEPEPSPSPSSEVIKVTAEKISPSEPEDSTNPVSTGTPILMDETKEEEGSTICDVSDSQDIRDDDDDDSEKSESDEPAEPLSSESPTRAPPIISSTSTPTTSSATEYYHDAKTAFLTKMGRRKNSFSEGHETDSSSIKSNSTHLSSTSSTNAKLSKKRSSKLFGKLVPKFLQTSFSPTLSTSSTSPRSQTASLSPLSTRSNRSGSMGGHSPSGKADNGSVKSVGSSPAFRTGSQELLTRRSGLDLEQCSPGVDEPTCPEYLESLRAEMNGSPSVLSGRRSSCSSNASRRSSHSNGSKPSESLTTSVDKAETDAIKNGQGHFTFEVEYDEDEEDEDEVEDEDESDKGRQTTDSKVDDSCLSAGYTSMDPPLSPYIIDENCDDDFFLNSVLRKKSLHSPAPPHASCNSEPVMSCSYPSNATISTVNSMATTPSLSGWSNNSSQASTPSPTSPSANGQVYPFPVTGTTTAKDSPHYQYRSNPLPPPINELVDEKRSRLRDAVGEWRRTANQSC